jgi:hypothetical protein
MEGVARNSSSQPDQLLFARSVSFGITTPALRLSLRRLRIGIGKRVGVRQKVVAVYLVVQEIEAVVRLLAIAFR